MIKHKNPQNYTPQQSRLLQSQQIISLSLKSPELVLNKNGTVQKTLTFGYRQYPFLNQSKSEYKFYKTVVNTPISQQQLKNVVSISHCNMIQIQKISKGGGKTFQGRVGQVYYSIYYEIIAYSIKEVANARKKYSTLLPHLTSLYLGQQLLSVMDYLIKENISYQFQLDDIGVTQTGHVKVYISPLILINSHKQTVNRKRALDSIDRLLQWWKSTNSKTNFNQNENYTQQFSKLLFEAQQLNQTPIIQPKINSTSFIQDQTRENGCLVQKSEGNIMHRSQTHLNENGPLSYEKMKKLDKQIKHIREILNQRVKVRGQKERDAFTPKASKEKETKIIKTPEVQRPKKEIKIEQPKVQSIQQNIHCINIFHSPVPLALDEVAHRHKTNKFLHVNNKMAKDKKQHKGEAVKPNIAAVYYNQIPDDLYHEEEDNLSIDTYDMDIGLDFQTSADTKNKIPFASRQREISQRNYKAKKDESNKVKQGSNQVINKNVTVSAGPKQFKNFVVNFVKPQFMAKKSNIYEDPGEYQSQNSKSIVSNKFSIHYKELNEAGKSVTSHTQKSSSLAKQSVNRLQNKIVANQQIDQNPNTKYMKKARIMNTESTAFLPENKFLKAQRSQTALGSKKLQDLQIGKKVIIALQKTKNAIALLNKAKQINKKLTS